MEKHVTNARGERRASRTWVAPVSGGWSSARVTDAYELPVGVVVCVQASEVAWCLVASEETVPTRVLIRYYGKLGD